MSHEPTHNDSNPVPPTEEFIHNPEGVILFDEPTELTVSSGGVRSTATVRLLPFSVFRENGNIWAGPDTYEIPDDADYTVVDEFHSQEDIANVSDHHDALEEIMSNALAELGAGELDDLERSLRAMNDRIGQALERDGGPEAPDHHCEVSLSWLPEEAATYAFDQFEDRLAEFLRGDYHSPLIHPEESVEFDYDSQSVKIQESVVTAILQDAADEKLRGIKREITAGERNDFSEDEIIAYRRELHNRL